MSDLQSPLTIVRFSMSISRPPGSLASLGAGYRQAVGRTQRWSQAVPKCRIALVPELCRFFGIIIRMFSEVGAQHHTPHFHAYYQEEVGIFSIDPVELITGSLPKRQRRLVEAWAELHQQELMADWDTLQEGKTPQPIEPLK
jgi:hypothetical protein